MKAYEVHLIRTQEVRITLQAESREDAIHQAIQPDFVNNPALKWTYIWGPTCEAKAVKDEVIE